MRIVPQFRPITQWPGELTKQRKSSQFRSGYQATVDKLASEVDQIDGHDLVIELAVTAGEIRADGWPRARMWPAHPGVIVSFGSKHGPLRYWTDEFVSWQANLRGIALGLEALRAVDRYGISRRGEQYTGWSALPPADEKMSVERAARFLADAVNPPVDAGFLIGNPATVRALYKTASRHLHPDQGGDPAMFRKLVEAKDVLLGDSA